MSGGQIHELVTDLLLLCQGGRGQQSGTMGKGVACDSAEYIWLSLVWICSIYMCSENHLPISGAPVFGVLRMNFEVVLRLCCLEKCQTKPDCLL